MVTDEKIKQIRKMLRGGEPHGEIIERLKAEGYSDEDISKVFAPHKYDMRSWYLTFSCMFLVVGLYLLIIDQSIEFQFTNRSVLMLVFSGAMFVAYYKEGERLKRNRSKNEADKADSL